MRRTWLPCLIMALAASAAARAGDKGTNVTIDGFKATTPAAWVLKETKVPFRVYTFTVPKAAGDENDAEVVVSFTGKGSGGDLKANITRWQDQFSPPKGKSIDDVTRTEKFKVGEVNVTVVEIEGTYRDKTPPFGPSAKVVSKPDYKRVNVIFASENGPYFIYFVGPAKTIAGHRDAFDKWLKSFK